MNYFMRVSCVSDVLLKYEHTGEIDGYRHCLPYASTHRYVGGVFYGVVSFFASFLCFMFIRLFY